MATELKINITTHYADAEKGFNKVTGSVNKFRKELFKVVDADKEAKEAVNEYKTALEKAEQAEKKAKAATEESRKIRNGAIQAYEDMSKAMEQEKAATEKVAKAKAAYEKAVKQSEATEKKLTQACEDYGNAMSRDLSLIDQTKEGLKALIAMKQKLKNELTQVGLTLGENNGAYKELQTRLQEIETEIQNVSEANSGMGKGFGSSGLKILEVAKNILKFQLLMGPITAAINGLKNGLSDSVKVAAEAEQIFSKLNTVFTNLETNAKNMAKSLASSIGVAQSTAADALSTVGDLLQAQGMDVATSLSTAAKWVSQFQDIIAFKDINMTLEEFAQNFMSGAAGNLRNFRTFGSIVKESSVNAELAKKGLDQLTGSELELAKMTARAEMALEQQANAMGATTREWDTMQSVTRRYNEASKQLKENVGDTINDFFKPMKEWLTELMEGWNAAAEARKKYNDMDSVAPTTAYDPSNKEDVKALKALVGNSGTARTGVLHDRRYEYTMSAEATAKVAHDQGADVQTVLNMFEKENKWLLDASYDRQEIEKEAVEILKKMLEEDEKEEEINALNAYKDATLEEFSKFTEALNETKGATTLDSLTTFISNMINSSGSQESVDDAVKSNVLSLAQNYTNQLLNNNDLKSFVSPIDYNLGKVSDDDMKQAKADVLEQDYTTLWNEFTKLGMINDEGVIALLQSIADQYKELTGEVLEQSTAWDEAVKNLKGDVADQTADLARTRYGHSLTGTDEQNAYDMAVYDAKVQRDANVQTLLTAKMADNPNMTEEELKQASQDAYTEANRLYLLQIDAAKETYDYAVKTKEEKEAELAEQKRQTALANAKTTLNDKLADNTRATFEANYTGSDVDKAYDLAINYDIKDAVAKYKEALEEAEVATEDVTYWTGLYEEALKQEAEITKENAIEKAKQSGRDTVNALADANLKSLVQANINKMEIPDYEKAYKMFEYTLPDTLEAFGESLRKQGVAEKDIKELTEDYEVELKKVADLTKTLAEEEARNSTMQWANAQIGVTKNMLTDDTHRQWLMDKYGRSEEWANKELALSKVDSEVIDFEKQLRERGGLTEDEIKTKKEDYRQSRIDNANDDYNKAIADKIGALVDKINPIADVMSSWDSGIDAFGDKFKDLLKSKGYDQNTAVGLGDFMSGALGLLMDLVSQTEAFQELTNVVSDAIVPVLDAFLEPLLPVIKVIGKLIQVVVYGALLPLFPIIQQSMLAIIKILGPIWIAIQLVIDTIKWCIGNLTRVILQAIDSIPFVNIGSWYKTGWVAEWSSTNIGANLEKNTNELNDMISQIKDSVYEIEDNTEDKTDWQKILEELYKQNVINEEQYYAGLGIHSDKPFGAATAGELNYVQYQEPPQTVTTYYGGVSIYIDGNDSEAMKETLKEFFEEQGIPYNYGYGK